MKITMHQINQQQNHLLSVTSEISFDEVVRSVRNLAGLSPIHVDLQLQKVSDNRVEVTGRLSGEMTLICSRCLKRFPQKFIVELEETFTSAPIDDESDDYAIEQGELDLTEMLRENLVLAIPFAPVCEEDCKGICAVCGNNRNEQHCTCEQEQVDPRFEKLQSLFGGKNQK
ncbi:YceD family protein [Risungbinella massiliensis]|uniref:YceD family protein n=1 Tax=Risungbinella massiliensis TaxID=1329796 RepID=UPI00069B4EDA|nr:DUF177 domain-containing protein [Risungbinella massiliensis]